MIDASAFLSVAGARAAYRRAAPPLRDAHVAALAAGFTRRAAPLGCVVQLFAPRRPRRRGRWPACRWRTRTPSTPAACAPPGRPRATGSPSRRVRAAAAGRAWRAEPGRAGHGRACLRGHGGEPARASPDEPAGQRGGGRRLFQRLGGRGGGRPVPGLAGHGHRRLGPHAGRDLRPDRPEAHAGTLVRARRGPLAPTLDTVGVIARDALDAASVFAAALPAGDETRVAPAAGRAGRELARPRDGASPMRCMLGKIPRSPPR